MLYVPTLIESRHHLASRGGVEGSFLSFILHTTLIGAAVYGTMAATRAAVERRLVVDLTLPSQEAPPPPRPEQPVFGQAPLAFNRLEIPTVVLSEIPPPSSAPFDPTSFAGVGVEASAVWGRAPAVAVPARPARDSVYEADLLEERPVRLGGEPPAYPQLLRSAGIQGRVDVEFVVDTAGHVEPRSLRVLHSTNRLFDQPALDAAKTWVFRPGRIGGVPVLARVWLPVNFTK